MNDLAFVTVGHGRDKLLKNTPGGLLWESTMFGEGIKEFCPSKLDDHNDIGGGVYHFIT
jgi:hypothetical protein